MSIKISWTIVFNAAPKSKSTKMETHPQSIVSGISLSTQMCFFFFFAMICNFSQILFLTGLAFIIGLKRTAHFFFQRQKLRASSFFLGGVALVVLRWPRIGMLVESYGFVLLFKWVRFGSFIHYHSTYIKQNIWFLKKWYKEYQSYNSN